MQTSEFQKNIIQNIRGFYLTQIISHLGKLGYLDKILNGDLINLKKQIKFFYECSKNNI